MQDLPNSLDHCLSHKPTFLTHHSYNQNRLDVFWNMKAKKYQKGIGLGTPSAYLNRGD